MWIRLDELPPPAAERLRVAHRQGGFGTGSYFGPYQRNRMLFTGLGALMTGGAALAFAAEIFEDAVLQPWITWALLLFGLISLFYATLALADFLMGWRAELRGFLLVTPVNLVLCRGSHRPLQIHRLQDATAFSHIDKYNREKWTGREFTFAFSPGDQVRFTLSNKPQIQALEAVLLLARNLTESFTSAPGAEPDLLAGVPPPASTAHEPSLLDPASPFWTATCGVLLLAGIVVILILGYRS
ncbi:MAG: hypothetical protein KGI56_09380 [Acidobacteriota bacterium]|nr:hypothetical protein [Acidobacteriota bacterium]